MTTTGSDEPSRKRATSASTSRTPTRSRSAHSDARWMSGPSAMGSENGMPTSIASAPARSNARIMANEASSDG